MKKNTVKLDENSLKQIVAESVKKILSEGSTDQKLYNRWLDIEEILGSETMLAWIWNYLDTDTLARMVEDFSRDLDADGIDF